MPKCAVRMGVAGIWTFGLAFGLGACSDTTGADPSDAFDSPTGENTGSGSTPSAKSSSSAANKASSSSKKAETVSSEEELNEAAMVVNGTCGPKIPVIEKGGTATWEFYRESGDVFDAIMAPYVWNFVEMSKTVQGNGMNTVNITYKEPGTYSAVLNVDGTKVTCSTLQVQGIPIVVNSCKADKETAKAGETITWTVEAESEAKITGYNWSSENGVVSGSGATATMDATADMHKKSVSATVAVTNNDKTTQTYLCESVTVLDPESVDLVLGVGDINAYTEKDGKLDVDESLIIASGTPMTVQVPATASNNCNIGCKPIVGADYMNAVVTWDDVELGQPVGSSLAYFSPAGCAPGKKYAMQSNVNVFCIVIKNN